MNTPAKYFYTLLSITHCCLDTARNKMSSSILFCAVLLSLAACTSNNGEVPSLSLVEDFAVSLESATSVRVHWTTDKPTRSVVSYNMGEQKQQISSDAKRREHSVLIENLEPGGVYDYIATASIEGASVEEKSIFVVPERLAFIYAPDEDWVSGTVPVVAAEGDVSVAASKAEFFARSVEGGEWISLGTDKEGADEGSTCANEPDKTGNGWSVEWNTKDLAEGLYQLKVVFDTRIGLLEDIREVYVDPEPPVADITTPDFGDIVKGKLSIVASQSVGDRALFEMRKAQLTYTMPQVQDLTQTDYPYDKKGGTMMCDPTSEAAILWSYKEIRDRVTGQGKTLADFVKLLAKWKGTNKKGTTARGEKAGWKKITKAFGAKWKCNRTGSNRHTYAIKNFKANIAKAKKNKNLKGVMVHIKPKGQPAVTGHLMVVKKFIDKAGGITTIFFMDPATGTEIEVEVAKDGTFTHPTSGASQIQYITIIEGPESATASSTAGLIRKLQKLNVRYATLGIISAAEASVSEEEESDWLMISVDQQNQDGWQATWDTKDLEPGPYFVRMTVFDKVGHSAEDTIEVWVP